MGGVWLPPPAVAAPAAREGANKGLSLRMTNPRERNQATQRSVVWLLYSTREGLVLCDHNGVLCPAAHAAAAAVDAAPPAGAARAARVVHAMSLQNQEGA